MFNTNPREGLMQFFEAIWGSDTGLVYIPIKDPTRPPEAAWSKAFFRWPTSKDRAVDHVLAACISHDVYFSPVLWEKPSIEKSSVKHTNVLWADFDGSAPSQWTSEPGQAPTEAQAAVPGHPSIIVQSSTESHQHVYWRLDEPNSDVEWVQNTNRAIAYSCGADTSGWDIEQILRPPFTTNYKRNLPVLVASWDDVKFSSNSFKSFGPIKQIVSESIDEASLPDALVVIGKFVWPSGDLELLHKDIPEGRRSSAYMRIGFKCAELGMTDVEIYSVLSYLDNRIGKFKDRSDRKRRLLDIVNKARQRYPHAVESPTFAGLLGATEVEQDIQYFYGFNTFIQQDFRVDWAIEDLMPLQGCGVIVSPPGVGKSQWMTQLGLHNALNRAFCGYHFIEELKTLFFSLEMPRAGVHKLYSTMAGSYSPVELRHLEDNFIVYPLGEPMPLINAEARRFFESAIEFHKPAVVILDSLQKTLTGSLQDDEAVRTLFNYSASIRAKYGVSLWFVHHNRKGQGDNKKPKELDDVYGSRFITSEADVVLSMWAEKNNRNTIELSELKNRYAQARDDFYIVRKENLNFERELGGLLSGLDTSVSSGRESNRPSLRSALSDNRSDNAHLGFH